VGENLSFHLPIESLQLVSWNVSVGEDGKVDSKGSDFSLSSSKTGTYECKRGIKMNSQPWQKDQKTLNEKFTYIRCIVPYTYLMLFVNTFGAMNKPLLPPRISSIVVRQGKKGCRD